MINAFVIMATFFVSFSLTNLAIRTYRNICKDKLADSIYEARKMLKARIERQIMCHKPDISFYDFARVVSVVGYYDVCEKYLDGDDGRKYICAKNKILGLIKGHGMHYGIHKDESFPYEVAAGKFITWVEQQ